MKRILLEQKADRLFLKRIMPFLVEIIASIPRNTEVYLVGGTLRNLFIYPYHPELKIKQRDYDLVVFGNFNQFKKNLVKKAFAVGSIQRRHQTTFRRPLFRGARDLSDFVILDVASSSQLGIKSSGNIKSFIAKKVNFTVNGLGIDLCDLKTNNWRENVIFPFKERTITDLKSAQLRINPRKRRFFPSDIYACARFVSAGFLPPPQKELSILEKAFAKSLPRNPEAQKQKLFSYTSERLVKTALRKMKLENILK